MWIVGVGGKGLHRGISMPVKMDLQSWTKVLGTVLQYSYFSVFSRFPYKIVHPFQNFLAVLPPPTLYKVETLKKILDTRVQHCLWGEGRGWTCENWKTLQKCKCVFKTFVHDILKKRWEEKRQFCEVFKPVKVFFSGF